VIPALARAFGERGKLGPLSKIYVGIDKQEFVDIECHTSRRERRYCSMVWTTPEFVEVRMDAEVSSYIFVAE
jgi:hypothetical protein